MSAAAATNKHPSLNPEQQAEGQGPDSNYYTATGRVLGMGGPDLVRAGQLELGPTRCSRSAYIYYSIGTFWVRLINFADKTKHGMVEYEYMNIPLPDCAL